eukprot:4964639-Amphidinium_carterae.1
MIAIERKRHVPRKTIGNEESEDGKATRTIACSYETGLRTISKVQVQYAHIPSSEMSATWIGVPPLKHRSSAYTSRAQAVGHKSVINSASPQGHPLCYAKGCTSCALCWLGLQARRFG